jgi:hypothetical protein
VTCRGLGAVPVRGAVERSTGGVVVIGRALPSGSGAEIDPSIITICAGCAWRPA